MNNLLRNTYNTKTRKKDILKYLENKYTYKLCKKEYINIIDM